MSEEKRFGVPPIAEWCGLERYNAEEDAWERWEPENVGRWWKPEEMHPVDMAERLFVAGDLPEGLYRPVWAPADRRRTIAPGEPFEVTDDGIPSSDAANEEDGEPEAEQSTAPSRPAETRKRQRSPFAAPAPAPLRRPQMALPFDPPAPAEVSPLSTLVYIHSLSEQQRERDHQRSLRMLELMTATINARASQAIAAEQARCDQTVEFLKLTDDARKRADLEPLRVELSQLAEQIAEAQDDAAVALDAEQQVRNQLATMAQQPDGAQAVVQGIAQFMMSDAGKVIAEGLKRLLSSDAPQPSGPIYLDPAGT